MSRRLPIGAEFLGRATTNVRVWAPAVDRVAVVTSRGTTPLSPEPHGYFSGDIVASPGDRYRFELAGSLYPDPTSRYQPEGPHGPSVIVDPGAFSWSDHHWPGATLPGHIIYELHIGTFTREGTYIAASRELENLVRLGVTMVEVMPVSEFEGRFGWGYDGVDLFAPSHLYGTPDEFRGFVDTAHRLGLAVILDVVYNHLGPVGNYLRAFAPSYFTNRYENEWGGEAIDFDGPESGPVRELFTTNAGYWIDEFHLDGLRLDATHQIFDRSPEHIVAAMGQHARKQAGRRRVVLIAENDREEPDALRSIESGGWGLDGVWNDDFHHSAMVALTGRAEAYYSDLRGDPQELVSAAKYGYLFQGQHYAWQQYARGAPGLEQAPSSFVCFLQNHDQVGNSGTGLRGHRLTSASRWRSLTALLLLGPWTPLIFQGQEFQSSSPFLYFADLGDELAQAIRAGRAEFLTQFPSVADYLQHHRLDDPADVCTFERSKLDPSERAAQTQAWALHRDLLALRRSEEAFRRATTMTMSAGAVDGAVLSNEAFALRFFTPDHIDDRILIVNLGPVISRPSFPEPLLAPPSGLEWTVRWSSESPEYGGTGTADLWPERSWRIPAEIAVVLAGAPRRTAPDPPKRRRTA